MTKKFIYALTALALLGACDPEINEVPATSITFDEPDVTMKVGETKTLTVTVEPENTTDKVEWECLMPENATVENGVVTALQEGFASIVAKAGDVQATCRILITADSSAETFVIEPAPVTLAIDEEKVLTAVMKPSGTKVKAEWKCDKPDVVALGAINDSQAKIQGQTAGKATVTAYADGKTATCEVTVEGGTATVAVTSITLDPTSIVLHVGQSAQINATVLPENATNKNLEWTSSDIYKVYVVNGGQVTANAVCEATITVKSLSNPEVTATCKVTVTEETVEEVVDLGLSVKWRGWNLGATKPEEYGNYYAWGETEPKAEYWRKNYKWWNADLQALTKYVDDETATTEGGNHKADNIMKMELEDDAAHVILGGKWRIPTKAEVEELCANCSWELATVNGVKGFIFTSKINGKSIFLPGAGFKYNNSFKLSENDFGNYWINEVNKGGTYYAWYLRFEKSAFNGILTAGPDGQAREHGLTIRPVKDDNLETPFSLSEKEIELEIGESKQITATGVPENTQVYWATSDSYTASVSKGLIKGVGVGEAVITATAGGQQAQCKVHVKEPSSEEIVDLGLSVKWRGWNLGATKPSEYGDYYAWAEVETYYNGLTYTQTWGVDVTTWKDGKSKGYNMDSYKYRQSGYLAYGSGDEHLVVTKYNTHEGNGVVDNKTVLDPEDDAAHVILANGWRMPTKVEWQELLDNCTKEYVKRIGWMFKTDTNPGIGVCAVKFTSTKNGKSIYFPLAGNIFNTDPRDCSTYGYYWSSNLVESFISDDNEWAPGEAWMCYIHTATDNYVTHGYRSKGFSIRPVKD